MKKYFFVELIISIFFAIISLVLAIAFKDETATAIISATTTIIGIQNVVNIFRDSNTNYDMEQSISCIQKKISLVNNYIHLSELEKFEHAFCHNNCKDATIYIISNNLTNDKKQFVDEIISNINHGVTYIYIITEEHRRAANKLKDRIKSKTKKYINCDDKFKIYILTEAFSFCPQKYTLAIYDTGLDFCEESLRGFCCAQDDVDDGIYYFEMSYKNTKVIKERILNILINNKIQLKV